MKSILVYWYLFFFSILLFTSCEYEPSDTFQGPSTRPTKPEDVQVIDLNLASDTIYLYAQKEIRFNFKMTGKQVIKDVTFFIDEMKIKTITSNQGQFIILRGITQDLIAEGVHKMSIKLNIGTSTGSVADQLQMEGFSATKNWVLINKSYGNYNDSIKAVVDNGFLNIKWEKYPGSDFKEYLVKREAWSGMVYNTTRLKTNIFTDSSYVGEGGYYEVFLITNFNDTISMGRVEKNSDISDFPLTVSSNKNNESFINWKGFKYYNAVSKIEIFTGYNDSIPDDVVTDKHATLCKIKNVIYASNIHAKIRIVPNNGNPIFTPRLYYQFERELGYSTIAGYFYPGWYGLNYFLRNIKQISNDQFTCNVNNSLVTVSTIQEKIIDSLSYTSDGCSSQGFYQIFYSSSGKNCYAEAGCNSAISVSTDNLHSFFICKPNSCCDPIPYIRAISDIGTILINTISWSSVVYNYKNNDTISIFKNPMYPVRGMAISSNGEYIVLASDSLKLVHFTNSSYDTVGGISDPLLAWDYFCEFDATNENHLVIVDRTTLYLKDCKDFSTIYSFPLTEEIINIDYYNKEILCTKNSHLLVRNYTDGTLVDDIPIGTLGISYRLINHAIINGYGSVYFVNDNSK